MDKLTTDQRSAVMARIRGKDTQPEMVVRATVHSMGLRYRLHRSDLKGTPDLVFTKRRIALFVHGCFWHQHPNCKRASVPKTRKDFWTSKLQGNIQRDRKNIEQLRSVGWRTEVIWECETKNLITLERRLVDIFESEACPGKLEKSRAEVTAALYYQQLSANVRRGN